MKQLRLKQLAFSLPITVWELLFFLVLALFSFWLMWSTFSYHTGSMYIASKAWSDFASHIPLIRAFSFGSNFPPQYPIFAGEPIKYHFLFYFFVAMLEKIGMRLDFALNIPSALGFFFLLVMIYLFAKKLFSSIAVGVLSVVFFLFNGSFAFLEFFRQHPFGVHTLTDIVSSKTFSSFGPYDGKIVSAFWNLNIYTNQRHLALSYGLSMLLIYVLLFHVSRHSELDSESQKDGSRVKPGMTIMWSIFLGTILGLSFLLNMAVFIISIVVFCGISGFFPKFRMTTGIIIIVSGLLAFPQYFYTHTRGGNGLAFHIGYLAQAPVTILSFLQYWLFNLGLHFFLIPIGLFLAPRNAKKLFLAVILLFVIGNLFQFSPEIAANHKFFNYFMILGAMLSAYTLVWFWRKWDVAKPVVIALTFLLVLSGIIDFFPLYNDYQIALADYPKNPDVQWIKSNTPPFAIFFNTQYLYDNASLAGRKIFLGWPYFSWSAGYDTDKRGQIRDAILTAQDKFTACYLLTKNHVDYLELPNKDFTDSNTPKISSVYYSQFSLAYSNHRNYFVYRVSRNCERL